MVIRAPVRSFSSEEEFVKLYPTSSAFQSVNHSDDELAYLAENPRQLYRVYPDLKSFLRLLGKITANKKLPSFKLGQQLLALVLENEHYPDRYKCNLFIQAVFWPREYRELLWRDILTRDEYEHSLNDLARAISHLLCCQKDFSLIDADLILFILQSNKKLVVWIKKDEDKFLPKLYKLKPKVKDYLLLWKIPENKLTDFSYVLKEVPIQAIRAAIKEQYEPSIHWYLTILCYLSRDLACKNSVTGFRSLPLDVLSYLFSFLYTELTINQEQALMIARLALSNPLQIKEMAKTPGGMSLTFNHTKKEVRFSKSIYILCQDFDNLEKKLKIKNSDKIKEVQDAFRNQAVAAITSPLSFYPKKETWINNVKGTALFDAKTLSKLKPS